MMFLDSLSLFLQTAVQMGTHILLAILGGILCEKAGNMNLGIEGMMLLGASVGFSVGLSTANPVAAVIAAGLAGAAGAFIYAVITVTFRGNQVVTGLVLTIFGTGVSSFLGKSLSGKALPESISSAFAPVSIPVLRDIPILGKMFFEQSMYVHFGIIIAIIMFVYFRHTQAGLNVRAVGENPAAADASGINVTAYKYAHITAGGFLCGMGGAYLSLVFVPRWQENITAGAGWIAVALIIFSTWNPLKAIFAAYTFGALKGIGFKFQNIDLFLFGKRIVFSPQLLDMIPYLATIIVLVLITLRKKKECQSPASLSVPYFREDR
ncbi:ABC transporter permease [Brucepastera parasyntrophica]|uniref:ABC transporter permease n=1 Tax=Brucepastera parasyntrophica TaxID=2880008 RepID=UPI002109A86F|nr:ABC transporter permease [Brucepastera parasyntrophica]ULQ60918.1 ABC transporter permease [Brucepastera parasyntrophica]